MARQESSDDQKLLLLPEGMILAPLVRVYP
jgi:hypothetical protein